MYEREFLENQSSKVSDPSEITLEQPESKAPRFVEFPRVPTLYQIANAAFPYKWIWRRSDDHSWTEEELKNIELDEVKGLRSGWYNRYVARSG